MLDRNDELVAVARGWMEKAEGDFTAATALLRLKANRPLENVCFHAQQCVEKYLKSLLVVNGLDVPRTHNLDVVLELIPAKVRPSLSKRERTRLTEYAVITRYPGDYDPITLDDAREAVGVARRVRQDVRRRLPESITG